MRLLRRPSSVLLLRSSLRSFGSGLNYDDYPASRADLPPLVIAHGMLGSASNWASVAKRINQSTGRRQEVTTILIVVWYRANEPSFLAGIS